MRPLKECAVRHAQCRGNYGGDLGQHFPGFAMRCAAARTSNISIELKDCMQHDTVHIAYTPRDDSTAGTRKFLAGCGVQGQPVAEVPRTVHRERIGWNGVRVREASFVSDKLKTGPEFTQGIGGFGTPSIHNKVSRLKRIDKTRSARMVKK